MNLFEASCIILFYVVVWSRVLYIIKYNILLKKQQITTIYSNSYYDVKKRQ